ncbi:carboxypeptidase-like regulatory domain-containing protein [Bremerella sp. T1]|uniref:carboxypeptidase-like regulatory domain-containing protein n=1 Tax=Bremerella sp. TYQ1 TaxID=3119568 RepID=UPI001CCE6D3A|nr:carboxypeptidase-like regulatory domain-containing protein [Bremerella volcania]UBM34391.1 carboxypeptidase-like regulatory domain-containing protein [Bremerella volcania]
MPDVRLCFAAIALLTLPGCGEPPAIPGGTPGHLEADGQPLRDVRLTLYDGAGQPQAFAVSDPQGNFQLRTEASLEGVHLDPGTYRVTVESAGEFHMVWPRKYQSPEKTPLVVEWTEEQEKIDLEVPTPKLSL